MPLWHAKGAIVTGRNPQPKNEEHADRDEQTLPEHGWPVKLDHDEWGYMPHLTYADSRAPQKINPCCFLRSPWGILRVQALAFLFQDY